MALGSASALNDSLAANGRFGALAAVGFVLCAATPAEAQTFEASVARLTSLLASHVVCSNGERALVGIFPFDEALLPLSAQNAFRLYEGFLGEVIEGAPPCVRFIDGRGAFVTLNYLGQTGTLRETGQQQRAQIQESLASATYMLDGTVLESGGDFEAVFRLTSLTSGEALGRVSFPVPERFRAAACGDGALPIDTALRRIAEALLQRTGVFQTLNATGGRFAQTEIVTEAGAYLEDMIIAELSRASENVLSGTALRVRRNVAAELDADSYSYTMFLRYWPCEGDGAARLSITLRSADGRDITEARNISLSGLPSELIPSPAGSTRDIR
jgi:hypothetical protein